MGLEAKASVKHWYHHTACRFLGLDHSPFLSCEWYYSATEHCSCTRVVQSSYRYAALVLYLSSGKGHFTNNTMHEPNKTK